MKILNSKLYSDPIFTNKFEIEGINDDLCEIVSYILYRGHIKFICNVNEEKLSIKEIEDYLNSANKITIKVLNKNGEIIRKFNISLSRVIDYEFLQDYRTSDICYITFDIKTKEFVEE